MASAAETVIARFGGISKLADALGHKHVTTVQGWKDRRFIPVRRWPEVLKAARDQGIPLTRDDLIDGDEAAA